jgi:hypothetical protein
MASGVAGNVCKADQDCIAPLMNKKVASEYYSGTCQDGQDNRYPYRSSNQRLPVTSPELHRCTSFARLILMKNGQIWRISLSQQHSFCLEYSSKWNLAWQLRLVRQVHKAVWVYPMGYLIYSISRAIRIYSLHPKFEALGTVVGWDTML